MSNAKDPSTWRPGFMHDENPCDVTQRLWPVFDNDLEELCFCPSEAAAIKIATALNYLDAATQATDRDGEAPPVPLSSMSSHRKGKA